MGNINFGGYALTLLGIVGENWRKRANKSRKMKHLVILKYDRRPCS